MLMRNGFSLLFAIFCITGSYTADLENEQQQSTIAVYDEEQGRLVDISQLQNKLEILTRPESPPKPRPPRPSYSRPPPMYWPPPPPYYTPHGPSEPHKPSKPRCKLPKQSKAVIKFCKDEDNDDLPVCSGACKLSPNINVCSLTCSITAAQETPYCSSACTGVTSTKCAPLAADDIAFSALVATTCATEIVLPDCVAYCAQFPGEDICVTRRSAAFRRYTLHSSDPCANTDSSICYNACRVDPSIAWCPYNSVGRSSSSRRRPSRNELSQWFE